MRLASEGEAWQAPQAKLATPWTYDVQKNNMNRFLVVVPTYNEKENIAALVPEILKVGDHVDVLVVDDNSPDGTAQEVEKCKAVEPNRVFLLSRPGKQGLAKAYLAGFRWGLERDYEFLIEMDADFSHRPIDLRKMVAADPQHKAVVGSRYVEGGATANWGFIRKLISRGGSLYARLILGYPLRDWTGGFNRWQKDALTSLDLGSIQSDGYSFQIELKYRALRKGYGVHELPILFEDRRVGKSKMSSRILIEALFKVWAIRRVGI